MRKVLSILVAGLIAVAIVFAQETPAPKEKGKMECCKEAKGGKECCKEAKGTEGCKEAKGKDGGECCAMKSGEKGKGCVGDAKMHKTKKEAPKVAPKEAK